MVKNDGCRGNELESGCRLILILPKTREAMTLKASVNSNTGALDCFVVAVQMPINEDDLQCKLWFVKLMSGCS